MILVYLYASVIIRVLFGFGLAELGYWYFVIYYKDGASKEVRENYFYSDWIKVKNKLQKIRDEIFELLI